MDTSTILLIVFGLLVLFYFFLTYKNSKDWHVTNVILVLFVFLASSAFVLLAAATLKTRGYWVEQHHKISLKLEQAQQEESMIKDGDLYEVEQTSASLRSSKAEIARSLIDRGRIWRDCNPTSTDAESITLRLVSEDAEAGTTHSLQPETIVHAFLEADMTLDQWQGKAPIAYLGEYKVTERTETDAKVIPLLLLNDQQKGQLSSGSWALYETMPIDSYQIFAGKDREKLAEILPQGNLSDEQHEALLNEYLRHLQIADQQSDAPQRIWKKVTFKQAYQVEVDAMADTAPFEQRRYDLQGLAVADHLKQGEVTKFEPGDEALFDQAKADELIGQDICEEVERVYIRELRDYDTYFHNIHNSKLALQITASRLQKDTQTTQQAIVKTQQQIQLHQQDKMKLEQDLANFQRERDIVNRYLAVLEKEWEQTRARMSKLYQANIRLATELATIQNTMADETNP